MKNHMLFSVAILVGLYGCQNKNTLDQSSVDSSSKGNNVMHYKLYLASLDSSKIESINLAVVKFQEVFSKESAERCDSGYMDLDRFYSQVENEFNKQLSMDTTHYDSLLTHYGPDLKIKLSEKLIRFDENIKANGFLLAWDEGTVYVIKDGSFLEKKIYTLLSPVLKEYLLQLNKEEIDRYTSDAGILISAKELADRAVWWETFSETHKNFTYLKSCLEKKKEYARVIISGMDNTPLMDSENNTSISSYFVELYDYLSLNYPSSEITGLVKPFYAALKRKDFMEAIKIQGECMKRLK